MREWKRDRPVTRFFEFLPIRKGDVVLYALFVLLFVLTCCTIRFDIGFVSAGARNMFMISSIGVQTLIVFLLHRWIRNLYNYLFLVVIGCAFTVLYFIVEDLVPDVAADFQEGALLSWLPFLFTLQFFRLLKIQLKQEELAIPYDRFRSKSVYGYPGGFLDVLCAVTCFFISLSVCGIVIRL